MGLIELFRLHRHTNIYLDSELRRPLLLNLILITLDLST